jgi:hypothetical protein
MGSSKYHPIFSEIIKCFEKEKTELSGDIILKNLNFLPDFHEYPHNPFHKNGDFIGSAGKLNRALCRVSGGNFTFF